MTNFSPRMISNKFSVLLLFFFVPLQYGGAQPHEVETREASTEIPKAVSKWIDKKLSKVEKAPLKDFETETFFSREPAKLIGYIKRYDPESGPETGIYYASNELTGENYPVTLNIYPDGRFEADIPLIHPVNSYFLIDEKILNFYLEPGQTLAMILDWQDFIETDGREYPQKSLEFKGKLAAINQELSNFELTLMDYNGFMDKLRTQTPKGFKAEQDALNQENKKKHTTYFVENTVSDKAKTILSLQNDLKTALNILNYLNYRKDEKRKDSLNAVLNIKVENAFYADFLKDLPLNDKGLLVLGDFPEFINRFEYITPLEFSARYKVEKSRKSLLEYFDELGVELTEKEKELHSRLEKGPIFDETIEKFKADLKAFYEKYKKEMKAYAEYLKPFGNPKTDFIRPWKKKDSVMINHLHLKNDLVYDITKIRKFKYEVNDLIDKEEEAYEYWNKLSASIEDPFLKKEGRRIIEEKFPPKNKFTHPDGKNSSSVSIKSKIIPLPEGKAKSLFDTLIRKHRGKIIFVDFWATWCGPCIGTIKRMKETRKKHLDNPDFDFVFITDESSPLERYENFISEQEMKNSYRVDTDTYNYFRYLFKFNGIPKYIVLNKEGDLIDDDFSMFRFENRLPRILEKHK